MVWQTRVGRGGTMGGVQWGTATDGANIYVANSDIGRIMLTYSNSTDADPKQGGGMFALRLSDGERVWYQPPASCGTRPRCSPAQSAAVSAIPGVVFSGSVDGHMRAYSTADGTISGTSTPSTSTRASTACSAAADRSTAPAPSPTACFVNSGYPTAGGTPGNVLLAFTVDGNRAGCDARKRSCRGGSRDRPYLASASVFRVVLSVNSSDSRGRLVTKGPTIHPSPNGMSRVNEIDSHSTYTPPSRSSKRQ